MSALGFRMSDVDSNHEEASVGAGFHACPWVPIYETPNGQARRPAPTTGCWQILGDDTKSVTAGGRGSPPLRRIYVTLTMHKLRADTAVRPYVEDL